MKSGFTLIELLLVIALIVVVGTLTTPFAGAFLLRVQHESAVNAVITAFHTAQASAVDGKGSGTWGVCVTGQNIRVYLGTCGSPTQKIDHNFGTAITVSGLSDTTFTRGSGTPSSTSTIIVSSAITSNTITINSLGVVNVP